jgi:hypothetical protein
MKGHSNLTLCVNELLKSGIDVDNTLAVNVLKVDTSTIRDADKFWDILDRYHVNVSPSSAIPSAKFLYISNQIIR